MKKNGPTSHSFGISGFEWCSVRVMKAQAKREALRVNQPANADSALPKMRRRNGNLPFELCSLLVIRGRPGEVAHQALRQRLAAQDSEYTKSPTASLSSLERPVRRRTMEADKSDG